MLCANLTAVRLALLCWAATSLPCLAAEYSFVPPAKGGANGTTVISCSTPAGWRGWKDDAPLADGYDAHSRMLVEGERTVRVGFFLPDCSDESCPSLSLDTAPRDSPGPPDIKAAVAFIARELSDATAPVIKSGSFDAGPAGKLTIWRLRRSSGEYCFLTVISQRDVQAIVSLCGADLEQTRRKLDSLKELARSVRIGPGTFASADMIRSTADNPTRRSGSSS